MKEVIKPKKQSMKAQDSDSETERILSKMKKDKKQNSDQKNSKPPLAVNRNSSRASQKRDSSVSSSQVIPSKKKFKKEVNPFSPER